MDRVFASTPRVGIMEWSPMTCPFLVAPDGAMVQPRNVGNEEQGRHRLEFFGPNS
jgi:hypothetical protein